MTQEVRKVDKDEEYGENIGNANRGEDWHSEIVEVMELVTFFLFLIFCEVVCDAVCIGIHYGKIQTFVYYY